MATTLVLTNSGRQWNSLERLKASLVAVLVADVLLLAALLTGHGRHFDLLKTIGVDSAPSIIAAQHIKVAIADMDAEAANELLAKPGDGGDAAKAYDARRVEAAKELITAAKNITYKAEVEPITNLQVGLGAYEAEIQRSRDFHERGDPQAIAAYRDAAAIVRDKLFPAADALDKANLDELEKSYTSDAGDAGNVRFVVTGATLVLLALLLYIQWDLASRVRRLINPSLLAASLLAIGLAIFASSHLSGAANDLVTAKRDAFDSLHALWQGRAVAFSANADESKYLLQRDGAKDEAAFFEKASRILKPGDGRGKSYGGFLGDELGNITFPGEQEAAEATVKSWQQYVEIDARIRQLNRSGNVGEAMRLCLGTKPGESDYAFSKFDEALMSTVKINQEAFDKSVAKGFARLSNFDLVALSGTAAIAVLSALGLLVRIREFL